VFDSDVREGHSESDAQQRADLPRALAVGWPEIEAQLLEGTLLCGCRRRVRPALLAFGGLGSAAFVGMLLIVELERASRVVAETLARRY